MTCTCTPCQECNGNGYVWFSIDGKYFGASRPFDDLVEMESCDECGGDGVIETCMECEDALWKEEFERDDREAMQ